MKVGFNIKKIIIFVILFIIISTSSLLCFNLNKLKSKLIPDEHICTVPSGNLDIQENGKYDISDYESVNVNIDNKSFTDYFKEYKFYKDLTGFKDQDAYKITDDFILFDNSSNVDIKFFLSDGSSKIFYNPFNFIFEKNCIIFLRSSTDFEVIENVDYVMIQGNSNTYCGHAQCYFKEDVTLVKEQPRF